jgi:hypothetical protein
VINGWSALCLAEKKLEQGEAVLGVEVVVLYAANGCLGKLRSAKIAPVVAPELKDVGKAAPCLGKQVSECGNASMTLNDENALLVIVFKGKIRLVNIGSAIHVDININSVVPGKQHIMNHSASRAGKKGKNQKKRAAIS